MRWAWGWVRAGLNPPESPFSKGGTGEKGEREERKRGKQRSFAALRMTFKGNKGGSEGEGGYQYFWPMMNLASQEQAKRVNQILPTMAGKSSFLFLYQETRSRQKEQASRAKKGTVKGL